MDVLRIMIVDDHPVVREGLHRMLECEEGIKVVAEASNGEEAVKLAELFSPQLVFMDVKLPGIGGIEATRQIKQKYPQISIIMLTLYGDQYLMQAIEAGASGYLFKEVGREEILRAILATQQGEAPLHLSLTPGTLERFSTLAKGKGSASIPLLTPRERQMLNLIAAGATNKDMSSCLYLSESTVKREMRVIFDKLGVGNRSEAVAVAYRRGILEEKAPAPIGLEKPSLKFGM